MKEISLQYQACVLPFKSCDRDLDAWDSQYEHPFQKSYNFLSRKLSSKNFFSFQKKFASGVILSISHKENKKSLVYTQALIFFSPSNPSVKGQHFYEMLVDVQPYSGWGKTTALIQECCHLYKICNWMKNVLKMKTQ